jgi:hypothetical protein
MRRCVASVGVRQGKEQSRAEIFINEYIHIKDVSRTRSQTVVGRVELLRSGVVGGMSLALGYTVTLLGVLAEDGEFRSESVELAVIYFYQSQRVEPTSVDGADIVVLDPLVLLGSLVLHIVVLAGAGYTVARISNARSFRDGVVAGLSVTLGTVPVTVLSVGLFETSIGVEFPLFESLLFVGVLFPVLFGTLGVFVFAAVRAIRA